MRYNSPNSPMDGLRDFLVRGGIPITTALLLVNAITFAVAFLSPAGQAFLAQWVAFNSENLLRAPWSCLTYPLVYLDTSTVGLWNFLMGGFFFWSWGGSLERSWGSSRYGKLFLALAVVSEVFLVLGCLVLHETVLLYSFFLPLAGVTVAFGTLHPEEPISFMFFPIRGKYLALVAVLFVLVYFGQGHHVPLGIFACGGLLVAYLYVKRGWWAASDGLFGPPSGNRRPAPRGPDLRIHPTTKTRFTTRPPVALDGSPTRRAPMDVAGRWRDYQERRRLEKLWRNSGGTDPEREARDDEGRRR